MKRSFPINLAGRVFYIDEDAYTMLDNYLTNLTITFGAEDDREVVIDIENRISEILSERIGNDAQRPITLADVNFVIDKIGSPEQVADGDDGYHAHDSEYAGSATDRTTPPPYNAAPREVVRRRLYRDADDCVLGGVISGVCMYCGWSVTPARVVFVIGALCFPILVVAYLLAWMLIPAATTAEQRLEMLGREVSVDNIGRTVQSRYAPRPVDSRRGVSVNNILSVCAKVALAFLALIALPFAFSLIIAILAVAISLVVVAFMQPAEIIQMFIDLDMGCLLPHYNIGLWACLVWFAVLFIPAVMVIMGACSVFFKVSGVSRNLVLTLVVMEVILIVIGIVLTMLLV